MQNSEKIWQLVDARKDDYEALSDRVWGMPEICYGEYRSVAEHRAMLEQEEFPHHRERRRDTDRRDGRSRRRRAGDRDPRRVRCAARAVAGRRHRRAEGAGGGGNGHGCGHNLLGSAALLAATAVKNYLAEAGIKGRVRYYGCPAEEGGAAKTFMVRAGCFDGCRHRDHLAPRRDEPGRRRDEPCRRAHRLHVPRPRLACGGRAASRAQRARRGRVDECRRQLHARAHALGRAHPLRDDRLRRHRAERRAGTMQKCATRSARATCTA